LERDGYRPGKFWARAISLTQLVAGPMLALGLFTRLAACPIVIFLIVSNYERWRVGGYFWNKTGLEYTLMWTVAALYFLVQGGGRILLVHFLTGGDFCPANSLECEGQSRYDSAGRPRLCSQITDEELCREHPCKNQLSDRRITSGMAGARRSCRGLSSGRAPWLG